RLRSGAGGLFVGQSRRLRSLEKLGELRLRLVLSRLVGEAEEIEQPFGHGDILRLGFGDRAAWRGINERGAGDVGPVREADTQHDGGRADGAAALVVERTSEPMRREGAET